MALVRKFVTTCMLHNILFKAEHIPGQQNVLADELSRLQVPAFKALAPWADVTPTTLPWDIQPANWSPDYYG